jgi:protein TonB
VCRPIYPRESKKLREAGVVLVYVFVGSDGVAAQRRIEQSSGFERLDQAALDAITCFRFTPGTRAGVPQAMWLPVPIRFALE